jgi:hypothetical protein
MRGVVCLRRLWVNPDRSPILNLCVVLVLGVRAAVADVPSSHSPPQEAIGLVVNLLSAGAYSFRFSLRRTPPRVCRTNLYRPMNVCRPMKVSRNRSRSQNSVRPVRGAGRRRLWGTGSRPRRHSFQSRERVPSRETVRSHQRVPSHAAGIQGGRRCFVPRRDRLSRGHQLTAPLAPDQGHRQNSSPSIVHGFDFRASPCFHGRGNNPGNCSVGFVALHRQVGGWVGGFAALSSGFGVATEPDPRVCRPGRLMECSEGRLTMPGMAKPQQRMNPNKLRAMLG